MIGILFIAQASLAVEMEYAPLPVIQSSEHKSLNLFPREQIQREKAEFWYNFYTKNNAQKFMQGQHNGAKVKGWIEEQLRRHNLSPDLFFVGFIESGYDLTIKSSAGAVGPWQFMPATARRYGLRVDAHVDERTDLVKSTKAAISYLQDLHNIFHDWNLAVAAYNAGEFKILEAIRRGKTRNFKKLVELNLLPVETQNYLAKLWVVKAIWEGQSSRSTSVVSKVVDSSRLKSVGFPNIEDGHKVEVNWIDNDRLEVVNLNTGDRKILNSNDL